jgi:hypothetical protein
MKTTIFCLLLIVSFSGKADETIFSQEYKTRIEGIPITTTRSLVLREDGTYRFRIRSSNFLARFQESSYYEVLEDGSFRPFLNQSERRIFGVASKSETRFDWEAMQAEFERNDDPLKQTPLEPGMVDRTLYQYLMEIDMRAGRPQLSYDVVDKGRIRNFTFENLGVEDLKIEDEILSAFKLRRITETDERETLVWMAADLDYEIVKIYHREEDDTEYTMTRDL